MTNDSHGDPRLDAAAERWGWHPSCWLVPARREPRWWQRKAREYDRQMREVFGEFDRDAFWSEPGQSVYEDAGGAMLRRYQAMIGMPTEEPYTYEQAIQDLLSERG